MQLGYLSCPKKGETVCGDSYFIRVEKDRAIMAVVDGLGHGEMAFLASQTAVKCIDLNWEKDATDIIRKCHESLKRTRGAVIGIAKIDFVKKRLEYSGVGNIEFRAISSNDIKPISINGIVGYNLRKTKKFEYDISQGDLFVMFSDGISSKFLLNDYKMYGPKKMAEIIMQKFGNNNDDATIIVARYGA